MRARSAALNALRDLGNAHGHLVQDIKKLRTEEPPSFLPPRVVVPAPAPVSAPAPASAPVGAPAVSAPVIPAVPVVAAVPEVFRLSVPELFQSLKSTYQLSLSLKTSARIEALNEALKTDDFRVVPAPAPVPVGAPAVSALVIPAVPEVPRLSVPELFQELESTYQLTLKTSARIDALNEGISSYVRGSKRKLPFRLGEEV